METSKFSLRNFIATTEVVTAGSMLTNPVSAFASTHRNTKRKVILAGTGKSESGRITHAGNVSKENERIF